MLGSGLLARITVTLLSVCSCQQPFTLTLVPIAASAGREFSLHSERKP
jgi:hypothetical protein